MSVAVEESYHYCAGVTRRCARSFYWGMRLLPPQKRQALYAVYAFLRACDDSADLAPPEERPGQLTAWRRYLDAALKGECSADPCLPAFGDAVARYRIPAGYFHALIDGAEMDLSITRYPDFTALYEYCYRVASTVGLMCLHVWGYEGKTAVHDAERLGIAFQITNILRDLREDAERGRIYLPQEDLVRFGYREEDLAKGIRDDRFLTLMQFEAERAHEFYQSANRLIACVHPDSRACLATMAGIYEGLLGHMERTRFDVFASHAALSRWRKAGIAAGSWWRHCGPLARRAPSHHPPAAGR